MKNIKNIVKYVPEKEQPRDTKGKYTTRIPQLQYFRLAWKLRNLIVFTSLALGSYCNAIGYELPAASLSIANEFAFANTTSYQAPQEVDLETKIEQRAMEIFKAKTPHHMEIARQEALQEHMKEVGKLVVKRVYTQAPEDSSAVTE